MADALGFNVFSRIKDTVSTIGGTVTTTVSTIGGKIGDGVATVATMAMVDHDFDRVKAISAFAKQHAAARRKFSDAELSAAEARADATLDTLPTGYFEPKFNPIAYELQQLTNEDGQEQMDAVVERLTAGVETAGSRLSRHVSKRRDKLLLGMSTVAEVEDDVKAAFALTRASRAALKVSAEEVMRNMRVAGQTRRKAAYMEVMEVCAKLKRARDLQHSLKRAQERGDYGEAILLCVQCFQGVDSLRELTLSTELRATIQRLYVNTLSKLDGALTNICSEFDPDKYTKVLEGYMLQGIHGGTLSEKVMQCFMESLTDSTSRVVRSLLLTNPEVADRLLGSGSLEGSYSHLCHSLTPDLLRPALSKLMDVLFDIFASYHVMQQWHALCVKKQARMAAEAAAALAGAQPGAHEADSPTKAAATATAQQMSDAAAATTSFFAAVSNILQVSRSEVFLAAARRTQDVLNADSLFQGSEFVPVVELCQKFLSVGEAFLGGPSGLRSPFTAICLRHLEPFHTGCREALAASLNTEPWSNAAPASTGASSNSIMLDSSARTGIYLPAFDEPGAVREFEAWIVGGNPFKIRSSRDAQGRQKGLLDLLHRNNSENQGALQRSDSTSSMASSSIISTHSEDTTAAGAGGGRQQHSPHPRRGTPAHGTAARAIDCGSSDHATSESRSPFWTQPSGRGHPLTLAVFSGGDDAATWSQTRALLLQHAGARQGSSAAPAADPPGRTSAAGLPSAHTPQTAAAAAAAPPAPYRMQTASSRMALRQIKGYAQLLSRPGIGHPHVRVRYCVAPSPLITNRATSHRTPSHHIAPPSHDAPPLHPRADYLWACLCEVFDTYLVAAFIVFGGVTLEELVWRDDQVPGRLKATLVRILTVEGAKYKTLVEELQRLKPPTRPASSSSLSSSGGSASVAGSFFTKLTSGMESLSSNVERSVTRLQSQAEGLVAGSKVLQEVRAGKGGLASALPQRLHRDLDHYFSRTVECVTDLRDLLYKGGARLLLPEILDPDRGTAALIRATNYNSKDLPVNQHPWATEVTRHLIDFQRLVFSITTLPLQIKVQMWEYAVELACREMVSGIAEVRRCSFEGRACMSSLDLAYVRKSLRQLTPDYVKAYHQPWNDLSRWCQIHLSVYDKAKVVALVDLVADLHSVKRAQKTELLDMIDAFEAGTA
ncbi:MAG: hypothetical protein WDW38_007404 [Sanguina aurantia]